MKRTVTNGSGIPVNTMFNLSTAVICLVLLQFVSSLSIKSQKFKKEMDSRIVESGAPIKTIKVISGNECAMVCAITNSCCSSTYDTNQEGCMLFLTCSPSMVYSKGSQTMIYIQGIVVLRGTPINTLLI